MLRISIEYVKENKIPEKCLNAIQLIKEHMLSILRISYDHELHFHKFYAWNFIPKGNNPSFSIQIQQKYNTIPVDRERVINNFTSTWEHRYLIKLLTEGINDELPYYYRYLSMFRILEDLFKFNGKWSKPYFNLLEGFENVYKGKVYSNLSLPAYIDTLRNRCAHGKFIFKKSDEKGITQLDNKAIQELQDFMPLMIEKVASAINQSADTKGKFFLVYGNSKRIIWGAAAAALCLAYSLTPTTG